MTLNAHSFRLRPVTTDDAEALSALAHRIWHQHYPGIITVEQIDYMLSLWYTPEVLRQQAEIEGRLFLMAEQQGSPVGYMATSEQEGFQFIHKLYVAEECRGKGLGKTLLGAVPAERLPLQLRVNKQNRDSIAFYERQGFRHHADDVLDIGKGYIMDDYILVKDKV